MDWTVSHRGLPSTWNNSAYSLRLTCPKPSEDMDSDGEFRLSTVVSRDHTGEVVSLISHVLVLTQ